MRQDVLYLNQAFPFRQAVTHQPAQLLPLPETYHDCQAQAPASPCTQY